MEVKREGSRSLGASLDLKKPYPRNQVPRGIVENRVESSLSSLEGRKKRGGEGESFPLRRWPRLKRPGKRERERDGSRSLDDTDTRRIEIITGQIGIVRMHCCYAYTCVTCADSSLLLRHRGRRRVPRSSPCSFLAHYPRDYSHDLSHIFFPSLESSISTPRNVRCHCHGEHSIFSHLYSIG